MFSLNKRNIQYLSADFEYPRNFQASLIKEKALDEKTEQAIKNKAALFVPYHTASTQTLLFYQAVMMRASTVNSCTT
jgi:hypothetical protein